MMSKGCQRHYSFLQPVKFNDSLKQSASGTLSPDTITTTSSGYSTGGSSLSRSTVPPLIAHNQHKTKSKGFHSLVTKFKSFISSPKTKLTHSTTSREMLSTNVLRQSSTSTDIPSFLMTTSNTISLPFTYYRTPPIKSEYQNKSYVIKTTNFEKISAWLNRTESMARVDNDLLFIDESQQQSISSTPSEIDHRIIMKKTPSINRTPKRSTSLVSTLTRPVIERTVSPTSSFSSSILARGMSERMTPQKISHQPEEQTNSLIPKVNRRRVIDFSRRRTVAGPNEQIPNNKENIPTNPRQQIYRFSPSTSTNLPTKKYYFHSNVPVKNEDMLMNSYGLTLLQQQRQSMPAIVMMTQVPKNPSLLSPQKQLNRRPSIHSTQQPRYTSDALDDLLCDREVESYFYPKNRQSPQHVYINLETPSNYYQPPPPYMHGTLC